MSQCKRERKAKTKLANKQLAKELAITENYVSALESARAVPSVKVLLKYFLACGFDVSPLTELVISDPSVLKAQNKARLELIQKIYSFHNEQIGFLAEQAKLAEAFDFKIKAAKNR